MMIEIQRIALDRALNTLKSVGAKYKIILPDGEEFGELVAAKKQGGGKVFKYPRGTLRDHYLPHIKDLQPGDVACVPVGEFEPEDVRGAMSAYACSKWGNGSAATCIVDREVQIIRQL